MSSLLILLEASFSIPIAWFSASGTWNSSCSFLMKFCTSQLPSASFFSSSSQLFTSLTLVGFLEISANFPSPKAVDSTTKPTELFVWVSTVSLQVFSSLAAPIPQFTHPAGGLDQQVGPAPQQSALQAGQQRPALYCMPAAQSMFLGTPLMTFFVHEVSDPLSKPRELQLGAFGLQLQHPETLKPFWHFGQTVGPVCSHFPFPAAASQRLNCPFESNPSPNCHRYPSPRPYSLALQVSPLSDHPLPVGQLLVQSTPVLEYPAGHLSQQSRPTFSLSAGHPVGMTPAPRSQLSLQQYDEASWWLLNDSPRADSTTKSKVIAAAKFLISLYHSAKHIRICDIFDKAKLRPRLITMSPLVTQCLYSLYSVLSINDGFEFSILVKHYSIAHWRFAGKAV